MRVFTCDQCHSEKVSFSLNGLTFAGKSIGPVDFCSQSCFWNWTKANYDRAMAPAPAELEDGPVDAEFVVDDEPGGGRAICYVLAFGVLIAGAMLLWWWLR